MQNDTGRLKIHTAIRPEQPRAEMQEAAVQPEKAEKSMKWEPVRHPGQKRGGIRPRLIKRKNREEGERLTAGERMIRNTAVACALLLSVMALKNVDQPWSRQATESIRQAMTMRVDWDETLGQLSFVRALVPETALVFFNLGQGTDLKTPVNGMIIHEYTDQQPWLEYRCRAGEAVFSAFTGRVTAVGQGAGDEWIVLVEDEEGREAVYGYLAAAYVQVGQMAEVGQQIGVTAETDDSRLYFELRENGSAANPAGRMK